MVGGGHTRGYWKVMLLLPIGLPLVVAIFHRWRSMYLVMVAGRQFTGLVPAE
jgi:hypothetical protein